MKELGFTVTLDEANLILEGLGNLPFAKVYGLVEKLQMQAKGQLQGSSHLGADAAAQKVGGSSNGDVNG
jgi:hypothetical protein